VLAPARPDHATHEALLGADGEVHGASNGRDGVGVAGVPVGQVTARRHLEGAEDADVEVAAAHHREGVGVVEVRRSGQLGDRVLATSPPFGIFVRPARAPGRPVIHDNYTSCKVIQFV